MICIVDYGLGNIMAFENIYRKRGIPVKSASCAGSLINASKLILPGVGSFDWAMSKLNQSGMINTLNEMVMNRKIPVLGVCVGMQIMAHSSEEGVMSGLGWVDAQVKCLDNFNLNYETKTPHMGWNNVEVLKKSNLFRNIYDPRYYFLHSFYMMPQNRDDIVGETIYGEKFASAIAVDNIFATQFHPEKSHGSGEQLLINFAEL